MGRFVVRVLAVVGGLTLLVVAVGLLAGMLAARHRPSLPSSVILETELHRGLAERKEQGLLEGLGREKPTVHDIVQGLERAGEDKRVAVLVSDLSEVTGGLAQLQEVRDAVLAFRKKGKKAVAFADSFGELSPANGAYYLASAYDEIYLQPSGTLGLTGMAFEVPFAGALFDKFGVQPVFFRRYEFKSAPETFTEQEMSASNREQLTALVDSSVSQLVKGVSEGRHLDEKKVRAALERGPLLAPDALSEKLVDGLAYRDEVYAKVTAAAGGKAKPLYLSKYLERAGPLHAEASDKVALIFGTGSVVRGGPGDGEFSGEGQMRSGDVAAAFRDAAADEHVKAILFRIDSPGGSYVASDTIRRAVQIARKNGKPVIASMGNVAASGGYFVAMDADKVVAQPGTITGSIGVFSGKFITQELWNKIGVHWGAVSRGANALLLSSNSDFTPEQKAQMNTMMDAVYADFTKKAAAGRGLPLEKVKEVAKGRVWTGADAKRIGLVDQLGGMETALKLAKEAAKLPADAAVHLEVFPKEKTPLEQIAALVGGRTGDSSEDETEAAPLRWPEPPVSRLLHIIAQALGVESPAAPLTAVQPELVW